MKYWYLSYVVATADGQYWTKVHLWTIYVAQIDERISPGDVVFIGNQAQGIFAWGSLFSKNSTANDPQDFRVEIGRGNIGQSLISPGQLAMLPAFGTTFTSPKTTFTFLTTYQARLLAALMLEKKPPVPDGNNFIQNALVSVDEGLHVEYKNVVPSQIPKEAYEFAVAYSNGEGGHIYFGVSDDGMVVGLRMDFSQRDQIRKRIEERLLNIKPPLLAVKDYTIALENVIDELGNEIEDLFVIDIEIKPNGDAHTTSGGKTFHKGYSGRREL